MTAAKPNSAPPMKCRLCTCRLSPASDDLDMGLCVDCSGRPEAARLGLPQPEQGTGARAFTPAERSLISKLSGQMPLANLLDLLNERLLADLGPDAAPYTMEQLQAVSRQASAGSSDWAGLRRAMTQARRNGVLAKITPQVIDDFAVVFALSPAQALRLKEIFKGTMK